jgi:hypothetical protein
MKNKFIYLNMIVVFLGLLNNCAKPAALSPQFTTTSIPTIIPIGSLTPSPRVTVTVRPSPTFIPPAPTLSADKELQMVHSLQSEGCILPCYLGITPGKTAMNDARTILENLGGSKVDNHIYVTKEGFFEESYNLAVGDRNIISDTPEPNGFMWKILHSVSLVTNNDIVQIIEVNLIVSKSILKFQEYWSRYSVREIFLQSGIPDQIYTNPIDSKWAYIGHNLFIEYKSPDIKIELFTHMPKYSICTQYRSEVIIHFTLSGINSSINIYYDGRVPPSDQKVWIPIEEELEIDNTEFYNRVVSDPSVCFEVKKIAP